MTSGSDNAVLRKLYARAGETEPHRLPNTMTLKPTEFQDGEPLCSICVTTKLTPEVGRSFEQRVVLLWWRCGTCGEITEAVPLPPRRRIRI